MTQRFVAVFKHFGAHPTDTTGPLPDAAIIARKGSRGRVQARRTMRCGCDALPHPPDKTTCGVERALLKRGCHHVRYGVARCIALLAAY
jgi:hypothetical protein